MSKAEDFFINISIVICGLMLTTALLCIFVEGCCSSKEQQKYEVVSTDNGVTVEKITTADSITMYRVRDAGHYVYFTDKGETRYTYRTHHGKGGSIKHEVTCN